MLSLEKEVNMKKVISTDNAPKAIGPYSQAILHNSTLYCSGQIGINAKTGMLVTDNILNETDQVMQNILAILKAANMDFKNVVKCSIFMKDIKHYDDINTVYSKYFNSKPPAREAVQVSVLPKNVNVEISAIAIY